MGVTAGQIMGARGDDVATTQPGVLVRDVAQQLADRRIGAVVVVDADRAVVGMVSERDIVRRLASEGAACLDTTVEEVMTGPVVTCDASTSADELMQKMTTGRFRHVPVCAEGGRLAGIVSIGDVVKSTIEQLEVEKESLTEYVTGSY